MTRAVNKAYEQIKHDILDGVHDAGARLKEEDLADGIGVSRTPVREALRKLGSEGLVAFRPNQGAFVATWSKEEIEGIFGLRAVLESYGAGLAAARVSPAQIAELEELATAMEQIARMRRADYIGDISRCNDRFHDIIRIAAGNDRLRHMLLSVVEMPLVLRTFAIYSVEQLERSLNHHRELISALKTGDPNWAASVMKSHIHAARIAYFQDLPQTTPAGRQETGAGTLAKKSG